ncbi:MAG: ATPase [Alphaproteobacteria bacterium]|nr:ATPase [Alphaproteobacteria bacterium]NNF25364.1 ATPase [Paracoccaceae bacterium]
MSDWAAKRFWQNTEIRKTDAGYEVMLDSRPVRTPGKLPFFVPTEPLARKIAAEWQAQNDKIDPTTMPATRTTNSAIEKVMVQQAEVTAHLAEYGGTDLLCYRAEGPEALIARQAAAWDPLLDWARQELHAPLKVTSGVMPVAQDPAALFELYRQIEAFSAFELAAFYDLVTLPGSLVIGLAAARRLLPPEELWERACVDEAWQIEIWGYDDEAERVNQLKRRAFLDAAEFLFLVQSA